MHCCPLLRVLRSSIAVLAIPSAIGAQIATDRPDFVESSATVGSGAVQIETGLAYGRTGSGTSRLASWTTPTLLRVGIGNALEFRMETEGWVRDASASGLRLGDGLTDVSVGLKWHVGDESGVSPAIALLFHADLPSGVDSRRGRGVRPSLRAVGEWTLPSGFALGIMPGLALDRDERDTFAYGILGIVLSKDLSASLRGFTEISFEQFAALERGGTSGSFNTGLAILLTPMVQLDTAVSWRVAGASDSFRWTLGLSLLRPGS
jgi:Putative MetA-pathway of phenol degradation